jgi:hypothetical protein
MAPWPRSLVRFGAGLLTIRMAARLRSGSDAVEEQERAFGGLAGSLGRTLHWREAGIEPGMPYPVFRGRVALSTYENLAPAIERMKRGEADVLWPGRCGIYAVSSGTTAGRTKYLPVTRPMLGHFRRAGLDSLLFYTARAGNAGIFRGRHLFLGGSTAMAPIAGSAPFKALAGDLSGIAALNLPSWVEHHLYEPGREIAQMNDWPAKISAIAERTRGRDITLLAGIPTWILILAGEMVRRPGSTAGTLQDIWPRLECLVHGGVPIGPFAADLHAALGRSVRFHEVYPASEAFIAAQDAEPEAGLRLMAGAGVFYEFLPMSDFDEGGLAGLGSRAVPLAGVRTGVNYALVLTTPAGLARYVLGDVVRFVSVDPPRLVYAGRTRLQLSAFGEHVIEKELTDALLAACGKLGWTIANFHVAPVFPAGGERGRHEWWIELNRGGPGREEAAAILDAELQRLNEDYEAKRKGGGLAGPSVRVVEHGLFQRWLQSKGKWGGQNKMPRCRSDRQIADELAVLNTSLK